MSERSLKIERYGSEVVITLTYATAIEAHAAYDELVDQANEGRIIIEEEDGE